MLAKKFLQCVRDVNGLRSVVSVFSDGSRGAAIPRIHSGLTRHDIVRLCEPRVDLTAVVDPQALSHAVRNAIS